MGALHGMKLGLRTSDGKWKFFDCVARKKRERCSRRMTDSGGLERTGNSKNTKTVKREGEPQSKTERHEMELLKVSELRM